MRNSKRLESIRKLPCVRCGQSAPSEACHANWSEFGKSMGRKASDDFTVALCRQCHKRLDEYDGLSRVEAKIEFTHYLKKTNLMLKAKDLDDVF